MNTYAPSCISIHLYYLLERRCQEQTLNFREPAFLLITNSVIFSQLNAPGIILRKATSRSVTERGMVNC